MAVKVIGLDTAQHPRCARLMKVDERWSEKDAEKRRVRVSSQTYRSAWWGSRQERALLVARDRVIRSRSSAHCAAVREAVFEGSEE